MSPYVESGRAAFPAQRSASHWSAEAAIGCGYVLSYILLDWISYVQPVLKFGITPWNPQAGLTLAYLLFRGPTRVPWCVLAAFLAEIVVRGTPAPWHLLAISSAWIGSCYALLAALFRHLHLSYQPRTLPMAARIAVSAGLLSLVVATGYVGLFVATGRLAASSFEASAARYWVGDFNGILLVTPLVLAATGWRDAWAKVALNSQECLLQFGTLAASVWLIFGLEGSEQVRFFYPLFVPVIWIALRWGASGALLGILVIQVGLLVAVQDDQPMVPLVDLQFLMLTLALTGLMLGAAVAERADALSRVAAREAEVRALLATAPDAVLTTDSFGYLRSANDAARKLFALRQDEMTARLHLDRLLPDLSLDSREGRATMSGRGSGGQSFPADVAWVQLEAPAASGWLAIVRDATDRRRAEAETRDRDSHFAREMRFAMAGELASALAHELNQPITAVISYLRASQILAAQRRGADARLDETLVKAFKEANRAAGILRRLRDFYLGRAGRPAPVSLAALCSAVVQSLESQLRAADVDLQVTIDERVPMLHVDATRLEIVLQNVLANAIEAVGERPAGSRCIELRASAPGNSICIEVEDSGAGVPTETLSQLFEPLNTSKPEGMGLGLAISRSLLRAQSGDLSYRRGERLAGALFVIRLPHHRPTEARAS